LIPMAKIILKSPYLKPNAKTHIANYVRYVATREGVEKPTDPKLMLPATKFQNKTVAQLIRQYPDTAEFYEYEDYLKNPTRENADEFILRVAETHTELFGSREKYVDYIATRPGAVRIADHGLFSDASKVVVLEQAADEVSNHAGNVWTHIISLRREDAERLGYDNVSAWQELLRSQRNTIAKNMKIHPNNFRWYAAFHNKDHHPHIHLIAYSSDPSEPWLTENGIMKTKALLARRIFKNDLQQTYQRQTEYRETLRQDSRVIAAEIVRHINTGGYDNPIIEDLLTKLANRLKNLSGKKQYGFLPPDLKASVDRIVDELAKDERIAKLYDLWYEQKFETIRTYTDTMPEKLSLSQNDDFKPVKNAVVQEAQNIIFDRLTFEDAMDEEPEIYIPEEPVSDEPEPLPYDDLPDDKADNKYVLYRCAKHLLDKDFPEYDPQEAIRLLIQSAQQDYEWAQYRLGKIFITGDPVEQDVDYGLKWLWEAEAQSNQYAQILLGRTFLKGELVSQDIGMAEAMFEFAADQGNTDAQYALAKLHLRGLVEKSNIVKAIGLLDASANGGNEWAQYTLGKMLMRGEVIPKDVARAEQLLLAAVQLRPSRNQPGEMLPGNQYAQYLLGKLYLSEDGIPKDAAKAIYYLNESAVQGNQWAQYQLGKMLLYGKEVEQDMTRGLALLDASSRQGNIYADKIIDNYNRYRSSTHIGAALGSLRLLGHLARIMKNRLDEEARRDGNSGVIEKKLRQKIEEKKQAHGLKM
jgi:TPR repeat protein